VNTVSPHWDRLRRPLLFNAAVLLAVSVLWGGAWYFREAMLQQRTQAEGDVGRQMARYQEIVEAERIIDTLYERYRLLRKTGFVGEEPRLRWLDIVRRLADRHGIENIHYRLQERKRQEMTLDGRVYPLHRSIMELNLELLHEGRLLAFLDDLERAGAGLFHVESCRLVRLGDSLRNTGPNVSADCRLAWFTVETGALDAGAGHDGSGTDGL